MTSPAEPRGIKNNNPGNIIDTGQAWVGRLGNDGTYVVFDTPIHGIRAMARILQNYIESDGADTIEKIISRWAPPPENDTVAYVYDVSAQLNLDSNTPIVFDRDINNLIAAMILHENGEMPYSLELIDQSVKSI